MFHLRKGGELNEVTESGVFNLMFSCLKVRK